MVSALVSCGSLGPGADHHTGMDDTVSSALLQAVMAAWEAPAGDEGEREGNSVDYKMLAQAAGSFPPLLTHILAKLRVAMSTTATGVLPQGIAVLRSLYHHSEALRCQVDAWLEELKATFAESGQQELLWWQRLQVLVHEPLVKPCHELSSSIDCRWQTQPWWGKRRAPE